MNKKQFKFLWITIQTMLFIIPIIICLVLTPYTISKDEHYMKTINQRMYNKEYKQGDTLTDFTEAKIVELDAQKEYENRVWKLENKEIYYLESLLAGFFIGLMLQLFNLFWAMSYDNLDTDDGW